MEVNFTVPTYAVARFAKASHASTVTGDAVFWLCGEGMPLTTRTLAPAGFTWIADWEPVSDPFTVSVAVTDCDPAVFSVTAFVNV